MADDGFIYLRVCHKVVEGHGRPRQARHALKEIRETPSGRSASGGMKKVSLLVAALLLSVTTAAQAGALEDKELWERVQATIDSKAEKAGGAGRRRAGGVRRPEQDQHLRQEAGQLLLARCDQGGAVI